MQNEDIARQCMLAAEGIDDSLQQGRETNNWDIKLVDDRLWFGLQAVYYQLVELTDAVRGTDQRDSTDEDNGPGTKERGPGLTSPDS